MSFPVIVKGDGTLERSQKEGYFYIQENEDKYEMYIEDVFLESKPDPGYDSIFMRFYQYLLADPGPHSRYELVEPAIIEWDDTQNIGRVVLKGRIKRIK